MNQNIPKLSYEQPTLVTLVRSLFSLAANQTTGDPLENQLKSDIGKHFHYVFILIDGLGSNLVNRLPDHGILKKHFYKSIRTVFPSTTASALTSLTTGKYPAEHAIPGWWTYLPRYQLTSTILPFIEKFSGKNLFDYGVDPEYALPCPSMFCNLSFDACVYTPKTYVDSVYSKYSRGHQRVYGYENFHDAILELAKNIKSKACSSFNYIYFANLDSLLHKQGLDHPEIDKLLQEIDQEILYLKHHLDNNVRIVISADHGHINIPKENQFIFSDNHPLLDYLKIPPSGEPRVPMFHVKENLYETFQSYFNETYSDYYHLLSINEVDQLHLFGPMNLSSEAKQRIGDFIGIPKSNHILCYKSPSETFPDMIGFHAGLSRDEMEIPVFLI